MGRAAADDVHATRSYDGQKMELVISELYDTSRMDSWAEDLQTRGETR